jgi:hypothetical protein
MDKVFSLKKLLWIDGIAALLAGTILLVFSYRLAVLFNLPETVVRIQGFISLAYSCFSINLARKKTNPKPRLYLLVVANAGYALFGICLLLYFFKIASVYGILYLVAEILFIGALAFLEWRKIK